MPLICLFRKLCVFLHVKITYVMNYEELLASRKEGRQRKTRLPIGDYYREQVDGKWRGVVDILPALNSNIAFSKALAKECEQNTTLRNKHLLHFSPIVEDGEVRRLELEPGNYLTFEQLLIDNPAIVAQKDFIDNVLAQLVEVTTALHKRGIRHICYSPRTVFARKGDNSVLLMSHGSYYQGVSDQHEFYGDDAAFVAPEVLSNGSVDDRCDVYSIGKFMQSLLSESDIPLEYRQALKKAVSQYPESRFATPEDMFKAVRQRRSLFHSALVFLSALAIAAVCVFAYFELFPESHPVEFVKPAPRQPLDDLLDDGITLEELGLGPQDSVYTDSMPTNRDYEAKAEEIFRKRYEQEADRILSKIYNQSHMSNSEKQFVSESENTVKELLELQNSMAGESGISHDRAQVIASQIIDRITEHKKKEMGTSNSRSVNLPKRK